MKILKPSLNQVLAITNILLVFFTGIQTYENTKLVSITNRKYLQENRPYVYIASVRWNGEYSDLIDITFKNPSNFPAKINLEVLVKDENGAELMSREVKDSALFPFYSETVISLQSSKISFQSKQDPKKTVILTRKDANNVIDYFNSGKKINVSIITSYSSLSDDLNVFYYSKDISIQKDKNTYKIIDGKFNAN